MRLISTEKLRTMKNAQMPKSLEQAEPQQNYLVLIKKKECITLIGSAILIPGRLPNIKEITFSDSLACSKNVL